MSPRFAGFGLAMLLLVSSACGGDDSESADEPTPRATNTPSSSTTATAQASSTARPSATSPASATAAASPTTAGAASPAPSPTTATQPTQPSGGLPTSVPPTSIPPTAVPPTSAPSGGPATAFVGVDDVQNKWVPSGPRVGVGGTVTWAWSGSDEAHNLSVPSLGVATAFVSSDSVSLTFATAGRYSFSCQAHPLTMTGAVIVE